MQQTGGIEKEKSMIQIKNHCQWLQANRDLVRDCLCSIKCLALTINPENLKKDIVDQVLHSISHQKLKNQLLYLTRGQALLLIRTKKKLPNQSYLIPQKYIQEQINVQTLVTYLTIKVKVKNQQWRKNHLYLSKMMKLNLLQKLKIQFPWVLKMSLLQVKNKSKNHKKNFKVHLRTKEQSYWKIMIQNLLNLAKIDQWLQVTKIRIFKWVEHLKYQISSQTIDQEQVWEVQNWAKIQYLVNKSMSTNQWDNLKKRMT